MQRHRFTITLLCFLFPATSSAADTPELHKGTFSKWRDYIRPSEKELEYRKIPWRTNFASALAEGRSKDKPILLWNFHGHPLGCSCPNGIYTKNVFENADIQQLSKNFIPVAEDSYRIEVDKTYPAHELFRREHPNGSQGFYVFTPSGKMLGRSWYQPHEVVALLRETTKQWNEMSKAERDAPATGISGKKPEDNAYPKDGFILHSYMKDLPRSDGTQAHKAWNQDFTWFQKGEARQFLPPAINVGERHNIPNLIVHRLVRFTFVDSVIGGTNPFGEKDIKVARLNSRISEVNQGIAHIELEGESRTEEIGVWPLREVGTDKGPQKRGCDLRILGNAEFHISRQEFTSFELIACGTRWGGTQWNFRANDVGPAPIGIACFLAGREPWERVKPLHLEQYWQIPKRKQ